jgi:hypothetical protein
MLRPGGVAFLLCGWLATACTQTYIYGPHAPPTIDDDELVLHKTSGVDRLSIRRMSLTTRDDPFRFRRPTSDEIDEIRSGLMPEGVDSLRIDVDNTAVLWRDWALTGFGIGASTVLLLVGLTGVFEPNTGDFGFTVPLTILFASVLGTEFMLIGVALGAGFEGGDTDMRMRRVDDDR